MSNLQTHYHFKSDFQKVDQHIIADIWAIFVQTVNLTYFGDIAKDIYYWQNYDSTLLLEGSACGSKLDTFLDLHFPGVDGKSVTCIHHKVDDFNFAVINYPFSVFAP